MTSAAHSQSWRQRHPEQVADHQRRHRVRQRALARLGEIHPEDLQALIVAVEADIQSEEQARWSRR